jgi:hypothetical protein
MCRTDTNYPKGSTRITRIVTNAEASEIDWRPVTPAACAAFENAYNGYLNFGTLVQIREIRVSINLCW